MEIVLRKAASGCGGDVVVEKPGRGKYKWRLSPIMIEGRFIVFSTAIIQGGIGGRDLDIRSALTRIKRKTRSSVVINGQRHPCIFLVIQRHSFIVSSGAFLDPSGRS